MQSFRKALSSTLAKYLILRHDKSVEVKANSSGDALHRQLGAKKECKDDSLHVS